MLDWSLTLAEWLLDQRNGPHPAHRIAASGRPAPFPNPPGDLSSEFWTLGAGLVVGLLRRPQDQNGIVDDAVTLVAPFCDTSTHIAGACAIGGFLAALLDGWAMEAAMAQSLFVTRRGESFGREKGPSVAWALDETLGAISAVEGASPANVLPPADFLEGKREAFPYQVAWALGFAYLFRDVKAVLGQADRLGSNAPFVAAGGATLAAAYAPENLPEGLGADVHERTDLLELLDALLELRVIRYQRIPEYAARFRRKKC